MLCKYYWIVLYTVHVTAFCLGGPFFSGHGVYRERRSLSNSLLHFLIHVQHKETVIIMTAQHKVASMVQYTVLYLHLRFISLFLELMQSRDVRRPSVCLSVRPSVRL